MDTGNLVSRIRRYHTDLTDVEVKRAVGGLPKDIVETLSAFSNAGGGTVLLGLDETTGFRPAEGFAAERVRDALAGACADVMEPPLRVPIEIEDVDGAPVVRADIRELDPIDKPCFVRRRGAYQGSFIRGGDGDRLLTQYEVTQLLANRTQPAYDVEPVPHASPDDLDPGRIRTLLDRVRDRNPRAFADLDDEAALVRLNVLSRQEGQPCPTLGGLLALGRYPQQFFPQLFLSVVVLPGSEMGGAADGVRFLDNATIDGPIPEMLTSAAQVLRRNMHQAAVVTGLFREDRWDYPLDVLRELLVNALMHRDYSPGARGAQIQVELYPGRLVVKSPGGLYGAISASALGTGDQKSSSRNAALAKLLGDVSVDAVTTGTIAETRGSGLPNVVAALRRAGMSPPRFDVGPGHVDVTLRRQALLDVETIGWLGSMSEDALSEPQQLALGMMRATGRVTNGMLQAWGVDRIAAGDALRDLVNRGLAVSTGGKRYAGYRLDPAVEQREPPTPRSGPDPKTSVRSSGTQADLDAVVQAIRAGHDTARSLASTLGMSYDTVHRRLRFLRDRGIVEQTHARNDRRQSYRLVEEGGHDA